MDTSSPRPASGRAGAEGNASQHSTDRAQKRATVSQGLERIRQVARQRTEEKFTTLLHHISTDHLEQAFLELKEDAAAGVDGLKWQDYAADLERNLEGLHPRVQLRIPARAGSARCARRARGGNQQQESELHSGRRYPIFLRRSEPRLAHPLRGASDRR